MFRSEPEGQLTNYMEHGFSWEADSQLSKVSPAFIEREDSLPTCFAAVTTQQYFCNSVHTSVY
jgi:hypothetical protein